MEDPGVGERRLLSIADPEQLRRILATMLDEREFLSPYGIRALSRVHLDHPFGFTLDGHEYRSTTSRRSRPTPCSAGTRTGAGRCGSR